VKLRSFPAYKPGKYYNYSTQWRPKQFTWTADAICAF
jgi:hypothetical protein